MKIKAAEFEQSAPDLKACPRSGRAEFAFIGRSNVGKSSLINMLTARRDLARASDEPGKTKLINFFLINQAWYLVDLPGYGYAKTGHKEREEFNRAVADYLEKRRNLSCVFVLIDSRLPPQEIDLEFLQWLADCPPPFALVFTKIDKQSASQAQAKIDAYKQFLAGAWEELPPIFATSATTRAGRSELLQFIAERLEEKQ